MRYFSYWSNLKRGDGRYARETKRRMRWPPQTKTLLCCALVVFLPSLAGGARRNPLDHKRTNQQVERTVAANPHVVMTACVVSGNLTVHGWDRPEVRARISDGVQIELTRMDQTKSPTATELKLTAKGNRSMRGSACLLMGDLELEVPRTGTVNLQTNNGEIRVTDMARVSATSQAGSITLTKVHDQAEVTVIGGEIYARDSTGSFKLHTVGGSVDARDLGPAAAGDVLEANTTGGEIFLDRIRHQHVRVNTVSGEVSYRGPLTRGGSYSFQNLSGELRLWLPANSSFRLTGTVGMGGDFSCDFKLKGDRGDAPKHGATRRIDGIVGNGDASVNLSVFSGSIQIKKQ